MTNQAPMDGPNESDAIADSAAIERPEPVTKGDEAHDVMPHWLIMLAAQRTDPSRADDHCCPIYQGDGCADCAGSGRVTQQSAAQLEELIAQIQASELFFECIDEILAHPDLPEPTQRRLEWTEAQAAAAGDLLATWADTISGAAKVIAGTGLRRSRPTASS